MNDHMYLDQDGKRISVGDRLKLVDVAGPRLAGIEPGVRHLTDLVGEVVGLDQIDQNGLPEGRNLAWIRIDGDTAVTSIHPGRTRLVPKAEYVVVVMIDENGGNDTHVIPAGDHAAWRADKHAPDLLETVVRDKGVEVADWAQAVAHVKTLGGAISDVIALECDQDEG